MLEFTYEAQPARVVFGRGSLARLPDEVARLGLQKALVLSTPSKRALAAQVADRLGDRAIGIYDRAVMHVPIEVAEAGRQEAQRVGADGYVAIGGGTTVGLAKAIALTTGLPIVAIPTTYAGSEMTAVLGITEGGVKRTRSDLRMLPRTVIYDPELTLGLPPGISGTSGMNAIAHCVEALYAANANPITSLMAEEGIRALGASLKLVVRAPADLEARSQALYGAWLGGAALGAVGMGLHHKLCHVLGGSFDLPHAEVHTLILPQAAAYNRARRRRRWRGSHGRSTPRTRRRRCSTSRPVWAQRCGSRRSASAPPTSSARPSSPCRAPTPIRRRSRAKGCGHCSRTPSTAALRRAEELRHGRSLHLRRAAHADRALRRRARDGARGRSRGAADPGPARAPAAARPGRGRRRGPGLRQPGRRGQPQRRAHGGAARRPAGGRAGRHRQPAVRLGHGGDRQRGARDQGGRGGARDRGRRREHEPGAVRARQGGERLRAPEPRSTTRRSAGASSIRC